MNLNWKMEDAIIRAIGEMFIHHQLTDKEIDNEQWVWNVGLQQWHIDRALEAIGNKRSDLTDWLTMSIEDLLQPSTQPITETHGHNAPQTDPELVREFNDRSPNLMSIDELQQWENVFNAALSIEGKSQQDVAAYKESLRHVQALLAT